MYEPNDRDRNPNADATYKSEESAHPMEDAAPAAAGAGAVWEGETYHSGPLPNGGAGDSGAGTAAQGNASTQWQGNPAGYGDSGYQPYSGNPNSQPGAGQQPPVWHQNTWQPPQYQNPVSGKPPRRRREKKAKGARKGMPAWGRVLAGAAGCFVISACTLGVFVGLVNTGVIQFGAAGGSGAAFTINKLIDNSASATNTAATGLLTKQQVAEKVVPSVVLIQNYQAQAAQSPYGYFFGGGQGGSGSGSGDGEQQDSQLYSEGSGVIMSADGYIITNAHVVADADTLTVVTSDQKSYAAKLIGSDAATDLALLKIDAAGLTPAEFGSSKDLKVGDDVVAIGNPGGSELASSSTFGNVSALERSITNSDTGYTMKCIQTDAAINPGNSGGALVNMYGQVVGINSSKLTEVGGTSAEGLGFAIPIDTAQPIVSNLKSYGYVKDRAQLGISGRDINDAYAQQIGLSKGGVMIFRITNDSLTKAGVVVGDIITKIDDTEVESAAEISSYISTKKAGDTVKLELIENQTGKTKTATVALIQQTGQSGQAEDSSGQQAQP